ncbi:protein of unknown function [Taphrina deformans PYCC 5710]|uniref:Uncharacterized protein n=1 Tax=Taphrina deformans (strain PYCC 5710 / ATCC 11124 / CBS 356.35 / IMI 108563 / JCM 9778 / NBRC 8474) TaxID=1097556 RepID=R4XAT7_TAPDE|nr:protein of unknown function [Taphrina deformans PYCC 5710]|eukprot:CCG82649.1 protein of unknown function [Taphrina deformans PYCC 5710]
MLKISHQTRVNLRGAASNLKDSFPDQPEEQTDRVLVSEAQPQESFKSSVQNNNLLLLSDDEDEDKPADEEVDTMDWQPQQDNSRPNGTSPFTNTATSSGSIPRMFPQPVFAQPREQYFSSNPAHRSPFQLMPSTKSEPMRLAKQRFFAPERPTGLENLFSAAVTLDDEPLLVRSIKSVQRTPTAAAWSSLVFSMALFVPLVLGHPEIMAVSGTVILLMDAYFGLLPRVALASVLLWPLTWAITRALLHYNSGLRATFLPASYCTSFALHMGVQGWALYTVLQRRKRQTKRRTGKSKKLL